MLAQVPEITRSVTGVARMVDFRHFIFLVDTGSVEKKIDLGHLEAGGCQVDGAKPLDF